MGEAALKINLISLSEVVDRIISSGTMSVQDQQEINEAAKMPLQKSDILTIRHLTELVRAGVVKVI